MPNDKIQQQNYFPLIQKWQKATLKKRSISLISLAHFQSFYWLFTTSMEIMMIWDQHFFSNMRFQGVNESRTTMTLTLANWFIKFKVGFLFSPCFPLFCILTVTWLAFFQFSWFTDVIWSTPMWVSVGHFTGPNVEIKNYQLFASVNSRWKPPQVKSLFWSGTKSECKDCLTRKVTKGRRD
jgi:hypothetical protein